MVPKLFIQTENNQSGFAALLGVIIITALAVSFASGMLMSGFSSQRTSRDLQSSFLAQAYASACVELAIQAIVASPNYSGSGNSIINNGNCSYVAAQGNGAVTISSLGTDGVMSKRLQVILATTPSMRITKWQDLP